MAGHCSAWTNRHAAEQLHKRQPLSLKFHQASSRLAVCMQRRRAHTLQTCLARHSDDGRAYSCTRKGIMIAISMLAAESNLVSPYAAQALSCQGMRPYELQQCLKEKRAQDEDEEDDVQGSKLKLKQYEQPGELVTLPSGIQYRELLEGTGSKVIALGSKVSMKYMVYKLSSGAYFKYSSGGTPVLLFALGYGTEGKNDVGETYTFVMGDKEALPIAATLGMVGMRAGGRRRILMPPSLGWARNEKVGPPRDTFGASRRLSNNKDGPLLFEADVTSVRDVGDQGFDLGEYEKVKLRSPYSLPPPPVYGRAGAQ